MKEEKKLINNITKQIGAYFFHKQLKSVFDEKQKHHSEWWIILDMLKNTDMQLLIRISRKMVNYLCWKGVHEAEKLFDYYSPTDKRDGNFYKESNFPYKSIIENNAFEISNKIFKVASKFLNEQEILNNISRWIKYDQSSFLIDVMGNTTISLAEINNVLERYCHLKKQGLELKPIREKNLKISLIRRLLSDQTEFIKIAKSFVEINDINDLINNIIYPLHSHGKLGGKGAGLFLSRLILKKSKLSNDYSKDFKIPKTWYIVSDGLLSFIKHNSLEDIVEQKYKDIEQIRKEYPYIAHVFKNASFTPTISKGLSTMLADFGDYPLVIRSTSLLEDRQNSIFAGKYKSLFISNQGTKKERLDTLTDAIAEVYASTFGPDPIEYRMEKDLLDYNEEMGIMIQEVVGQKVGKYFFPAFAGVAFTQNNYRWSSRIKQEDGLVRLVPGLGTRAVDRLSDDFPLLLAPGKPTLRTNVTIDEIIRYSPKKLDVINLEERSFETLKIETLLKEYGKEYPIINQIVSLISGGFVQQAPRFGMNFKKDNYVVTFNGLINNTDFIKQINSMMTVLQKEFSYPIDIEFAHNGKDFYLLQCRPQSYGKKGKPAVIPNNIQEEEFIFSANKYISNGTVTNISHIVYINPEEYDNLSDYDELTSVGRVVGKLNKLLPKRQFILMGPGRWGSRGDIKLGVNVTYSEINNTAVLIEIARKKKDYVPELSFGTHFFQDLVEANILYLPLYPDDNGIVFNDSFFAKSTNILSALLPEANNLSKVIKVIDISANTNGNVLNVLMNGNKNMAVALIAKKSTTDNIVNTKELLPASQNKKDFYWRWRLGVAEKIATKIDPQRFGVKRFFIFGSTKNASAAIASDIDILIHFTGTPKQREDLLLWLDAWSTSIDYSYFLKTGFEISDILDIHIVTDEDIKNRTSFAVKIGAVTDPARRLPIGTDL